MLIEYLYNPQTDEEEVVKRVENHFSDDTKLLFEEFFDKFFDEFPYNYEELDDKSKAEKFYRRALELKPDYGEAIQILNTEY